MQKCVCIFEKLFLTPNLDSHVSGKGCITSKRTKQRTRLHALSAALRTVSGNSSEE